MTEPDPLTRAAEGWQAQQQARLAGEDVRVGFAVMLIYGIDAAFLAAWSATGVGAPTLALGYGACGVLSMGFYVWRVRRAQRASLAASDAVALRMVLALLLTLGIAWLEPALTLAMLLTVVVVIPTGAMRLPPRRLLGFCVVAALAAMAVLLHRRGPLSLPLATPLQQGLTGGFLLWTLVKGASVNMAGLAMRRALDESHGRLSVALAEVERLAERDELTGLPNRRRILALLAQALREQAAGAPAVAVAVLDVDHFKQVNDRFGHALGDAVLQALGPAVATVLRRGDALGRLGGEEFLLLLPGVGGLSQALPVAERVRGAIARHPWAGLDARLAVSASIGLALAAPGESAEALMARADEAMYRAKAAGRNRVAVAAGPAACADGGRPPVAPERPPHATC